MAPLQQRCTSSPRHLLAFRRVQSGAFHGSSLLLSSNDDFPSRPTENSEKGKDEDHATAITGGSKLNKWTEAIHPYQEPYWTGRQDPGEYLSHIEEETLPQFRKRRRKYDILMLRQAEQIAWQVELMKRAYDEYRSQQEQHSENESNSSKKKKQKAATMYNDHRQEALEARLEFMRIRRIYIQGKKHYKFGMQNFPIPEALDCSPK